MQEEDSVHVLRVKIWRESTDTPAKNEWRGEVMRLDTGDIAYFRHLEGFSEGLKKLGLLEEVV